MDAKEQLRRYLEQRREMGERELVLDGMTVSDVLRLIGATETKAPVPAPAPAAADDWRAAIRQAGGEPVETRKLSPVVGPPAEPRPLPASAVNFDGPPPAATQPARGDSPLVTGIVVGSSERSLFGGPGEAYPSLDELAAAVHTCTRCPLYETAKHGVPGEGSARAELVCVGEAPGATEDETGRPFVGEAGKLLTKILAAINLRREDVYICNVLKHRPPGNRNPLPNEISACSPYLIRQLELIKPKVILALGTFAAQTLLNTKTPIGKLRGAVHRYHGMPLIVTYHPAALLRNPSWKRPTWEDVQLARRIIDSAPGA